MRTPLRRIKGGTLVSWKKASMSAVKWDSHGIVMGYSWDIHGIFMDVEWNINWIMNGY